MKRSTGQGERISKLTKSYVLLREVEEDLKHGSYNKAVSASYFAVRLFVEYYIPIKTTKDDKIANALYRTLKQRLGERKAKEMKEIYLNLFQRRKVADHRPYLFSKEEAEEVLKNARELVKELKGVLSGN